MPKKIWKRPKLVVLYRERPEEDVLQACKDIGVGGRNATTCGQGQYVNQCSTLSPT
jgi:hypothetical protein